MAPPTDATVSSAGEIGSSPELTESEVHDFASAWYRKLDTHDPLVELLPFLADADLEMVFPEDTVRGLAGFEA